MEEKKPSLLSELHLEIIGPLIIFLGVIRIEIYYGYFGINILQFMELSEALITFLNVILNVLLSYLGYNLALFLLEDKSDRETHSEIFLKIVNAGSFLKRLKHYMFYVAIIITQVVFISIADYIWTYFSDGKMSMESISYIWWATLALILIAIAWSELSYKNHSQQWSKEKLNLVYLTFFGVLMICFVALQGHMQAKHVKEDDIYKGVIIELTDNSTIYSNENIYYIGKTNNYVFIHSELMGKTDVIPISRVKGITFPVSP